MTSFFFGKESPRPLALVRIGLGLIFLYDFGVRWPYLIELYSSDGLPMPFFPGTTLEPPALGWLPTTAIYVVLLFSLLAVTMGWRTRLSLLVACFLATWLGLLDGPGTFKKYSVIGLHLMLLLGVSRCGCVWSIDSFVNRHMQADRSATTAWPRRLIQLFLCNVYLSAVITKLQMPHFTTGDLVEFSLLDEHWGCTPLGLWLFEHRALLGPASIATLVFEFSFPFLVWVPRLRLVCLGFAATFHITIGFALQLGIFSPLMLVALLAFLNDDDISRLRILPMRIPAPLTSEAWGKRSVLFYALCLCVCVVVALARGRSDKLHHQRDMRRLAVADPYVVESMLLEQKPPYEDYFHRFEIGSHIAGFRTSGENQRFQPGMTVHGLARLIDNHPELDLDWLLIASDGREVGRISKTLQPSYAYATAGFELTEQLPPEQYRIILMANGYEVARKPFKLEPRR